MIKLGIDSKKIVFSFQPIFHSANGFANKTFLKTKPSQQTTAHGELAEKSLDPHIFLIEIIRHKEKKLASRNER